MTGAFLACNHISPKRYVAGKLPNKKAPQFLNVSRGALFFVLASNVFVSSLLEDLFVPSSCL